MAKRTPRSQADDVTASSPVPAPAPAKPRAPRARTSARRGAENVTPTARAAEAPAENRSASMSSEPSEEDIRLRAYQRYLERGGGHGMDFEDWLEAERELRHSRSGS